MPAEPAVRTRGLRKRFGARVAVDGLDLEVRQGETLALLGPNGAGKTTAVGMLATMLPPDGGSAQVAGFDVVRRPAEVRRRIGVVFQGPSLELQLDALQNLKLHAAFYDVPRAQAQPRIAALLGEAGLADRARDEVWKFSGGMRRRLEIVRALLHRPGVLFLDEPTVGLDPQARIYTWELLERLRAESGCAILLTTHDMHEADRLAHRVAILDQGRLRALDSPKALKSALGQELVVLRFDKVARGLPAALARLRGVAKVEWEGKEARVHVARAEDVLPRLLALAKRDGSRLAGLDLRRPSLEDVFIATTGRHLREGP